MTESNRTASRRTLAKGIAWSIPVVVAAAPTHAAAASRFCVGSLCFGSVEVHKCCNQGPNFYWVVVTFTNAGGVPVNATFNFTLTPSASAAVSFSGGGTVAAGATASFRVRGSTTPNNCSNATYPAFTITFSDGTNTGFAQVPGGSTGGNFCAGAPGARSARSTSETAPTETAPTETTPTETTPTETTPTETAPTETAPTETAPTETAPTETAPTETTPTETAPTETTPTQTTPTE
ncbi:hypothetical protein GCM10023153_33430 [Ornithinibacter aureus]|uniref:Uncharacterized protein n=1 Tax=Ornithinibacter aureus TaxID=622664 RepID=A0ABP8KBJ6_9MICO|nr:hypothetical protein [Ornithinibacter aureus]